MRGERGYHLISLFFLAYEEALERLVLIKFDWYNFSGLSDMCIKPIGGGAIYTF